MKRFWIMAAAVAALAFLSPAGEGDVGDLLPVELLYVYMEEGVVHLETDDGQWGVGNSLSTALEDLHATSPGRVFLETADYLVVTREAIPLLSELMKVLRPAARVCVAETIDRNAAAYLAAHEPDVTLGELRSGSSIIPVLTFTEGRYHIVS